MEEKLEALRALLDGFTHEEKDRIVEILRLLLEIHSPRIV